VERSFQNIRITGLDVNKSYALPVHDGSHHLYLSLSAVPPANWKSIFAQERRFPRNSIWCEASIDGAFIIVTCIPEEFEKYHLEYLKEGVKNTNDKFRLSIAEQEQRSARFSEKEQAEKKNLQDLSDRLKFD
jgi:hypothetical protein